jgi:hypothetical protein
MTAVTVGFTSPQFFCPFEPAIHPAVDRVEQQAIEWVDRVGLARDGRDRLYRLSDGRLTEPAATGDVVGA